MTIVKASCLSMLLSSRRLIELEKLALTDGRAAGIVAIVVGVAAIWRNVIAAIIALAVGWWWCWLAWLLWPGWVGIRFGSRCSKC